MLVFGTYRLKGNVLIDSVNQAMSYFSSLNRHLLIDTAVKYNHNEILKDVFSRNTNVKISWKIEPGNKDKMHSDIKIGLQS